MINSFEHKLFCQYRKLSPKQKLFFELLAFIYIGSRKKGKDINIEAQKIRKNVNGKVKERYIYTVVIDEEESYE